MRSNYVKSSILAIAREFEQFKRVYDNWAVDQVLKGNGSPESYRLVQTDVGKFLEWVMKYPERLAPPITSKKCNVTFVEVLCRQCGEPLLRRTGVKAPICFYCKSENGRVSANKRKRDRMLKKKR